jgi:hypothetical protein
MPQEFRIPTTRLCHPLSETTFPCVASTMSTEYIPDNEPQTSLQSSPPERLKGRVFRARVLYTTEGRDTNWSVLSLRGVKGVSASLRMPADEVLVSRGDILQVQAEAEPYMHRSKQYVRVQLVKRVSEPIIRKEYRADTALQKRYRLMCRIQKQKEESVRKAGESPSSSDQSDAPSYVSNTIFSALMDDDRDEE